MKQQKETAVSKKTASAGRPGTAAQKLFSRDNIEAIIVAVALALTIRNFVVQAFKIPSGSMEQTLLIGDHILVNKFIYGLSNQIQIPGIPDMTYTGKKLLQFKKPERGDVVVFIFPEDPTKDFIKRVVAVGGDTVEIRRKKVFINNRPENNPHIQHVDSLIYSETDPDAQRAQRDNMRPVTVPPDHIFVMGDNRDRSLDSRFWGFVDINKVRGKAFMIYWSWEDFFSNFRWRRLFNIID
jgi:signal peptidase I